MIDVVTLANTLVALAKDSESLEESVESFFAFLHAHDIAYLAPKIQSVLAAREDRRSTNESMQVKTAQQISDELLASIRTKANTAADASVTHVDHEVQPSLLGGFTVRVNNTLVDASVRHNLKQLRRDLRN
jgi:F0F1-type ATP synthase delta subunit